MQVRFIEIIGKRKILGKYWGQTGCNGFMCHYSHDLVLEEGQELEFKDTDKDRLGEIVEICKSCGKSPEPNEEIKERRTIERVYNTASGHPEPGDLFWNDWIPENFFWDNHKGPHLSVILPNGREWNIDSRASNCGSPNDKTHRCWCRHGEPEKGIIHVDKNGHTCNAGAGSIAMDNYHGFLHNNKFTNC